VEKFQPEWSNLREAGHGLLGGKKFLPQRVELLQGRAGVSVSDIVVRAPSSLPCPGDDLGLAEHGAELVDDGGLDPARGHAANQA